MKYNREARSAAGLEYLNFLFDPLQFFSIFSIYISIHTYNVL